MLELNGPFLGALRGANVKITMVSRISTQKGTSKHHEHMLVNLSNLLLCRFGKSTEILQSPRAGEVKYSISCSISVHFQGWNGVLTLIIKNTEKCNDLLLDCFKIDFSFPHSM